MKGHTAQIPELQHQLSLLEEEQQNLQLSAKTNAIDDNLFWQTVLDDCSQGGYTEILQLVQIYGLTVRTMQTEDVWQAVSGKTAIWEESPVFFKLFGSWSAYSRFKRALSVYPCLVTILKEQITADYQPNFIVADLVLLVFKLRDQQAPNKVLNLSE